MLCQMELTSHQLVQAVMESGAVNEMVLAEQLIKTSPQARKKWSQLPDKVEARLLIRNISGKERLVLTSMVDPMRFPGVDIVELYSHRWEIERGYQEMKHGMQQHRLTQLRKKAAGIWQELCESPLIF